MTAPDFTYESQLLARGYNRIAGVDEVGRGPLAGPVTAAAVILDPTRIPDGLNDSKKLSLKKRRHLLNVLQDCAEISVAHATVEEIDQINILQASHLAMCRALDGLSKPPDYALIDGSRLPRNLTTPASAVVRGDARCVSIAAASIAAKVTRDAIMESLAQQYPGYGFETNAGYPTKCHRQAIVELGITPIHRRSFKPVHNILFQENLENK